MCGICSVTASFLVRRWNENEIPSLSLVPSYSSAHFRTGKRDFWIQRITVLFVSECKTSMTLFSDFLSLVSLFPLQHNPPLPTIRFSPPSLSLPVELCPRLNSCSVPDSLGKAQYLEALKHTQTHTHSCYLKKTVCYIRVYQWQEQNVYLNILHLRYIHDM